MNNYLSESVVFVNAVSFLVRPFVDVHKIEIPVPILRQNLQRMPFSCEPRRPAVEINVAVGEQQKNGMLRRECIELEHLKWYASSQREESLVDGIVSHVRDGRSRINEVNKPFRPLART